jgi:pimeloyl-ACP methyl ester carboxylesterase
VSSITCCGVSLYYEEAGHGSPPIVLVHGAGGGTHDDLAPQFTHFSIQHRTVALDLRGHGRSDKPDQAYTVQGHTDDIAYMIRELGLFRPLVVGHSMGGMVAFDLAARYPDLPGSVAAIDAPVVVPPAVGGPIVAPLMAAVGTPGWNQALVDFMRALMGPLDDPDRCNRVLAAMAATPAHVSGSEMRSVVSGFDARITLPVCRVPALYIQSAVPADLALLRTLCPHVIVGTTVGCGHWAPLEVREQVNSMLDRFLMLAAVRSPTMSRPG